LKMMWREDSTFKYDRHDNCGCGHDMKSLMLLRLTAGGLFSRLEMCGSKKRMRRTVTMFRLEMDD